MKKWNPEKTRKMTPGGTQNDPHFGRLFRRFGGFGKKGPQKICFLRGRFFMIFWMAKKVVPRGTYTHREFRFTLPGLLWGVGGMNKDNPATDYLTRHWADGPANYFKKGYKQQLIFPTFFPINFYNNCFQLIFTTNFHN